MITLLQALGRWRPAFVHYWRMRSIAHGSLCLFLALSINVVLMKDAAAQTASFRSVDTDGNGVLSRDELIDRFGADGTARLLERSDRNGDNSLTIPELRDSGNGDRDRGDDRNDRDDEDDRDDRDDDRDDDNGGDDGGGDDGGSDGGGDDGGDEGDDD